MNNKNKRMVCGNLITDPRLPTFKQIMAGGKPFGRRKTDNVVEGALSFKYGGGLSGKEECASFGLSAP